MRVYKCKRLKIQVFYLFFNVSAICIDRMLVTKCFTLTPFSIMCFLFRVFDWINAPSPDVDLVLGFFIMSMVPTEDGRALGIRFNPGTLKQLKIGLKNMMTFLL